jgi:hypothetical protein
MKLAGDDVVTWTFNGPRIACTAEKAREMLRAEFFTLLRRSDRACSAPLMSA